MDARQQWESYVRTELGRFYVHCNGITYLWANSAGADSAVARFGGDSELAAFSGPWHVIRKHLTTEFRQWVEEYEGTARLTYTEWRAQAAADRVELAYLDSPESALDQLITLRRLDSERDNLIREAVAKGASKSETARAIGLSRQQVHTICSTVPTELVEIAGELVEVF